MFEGSGEFIFRAVNNMSELLFNPPVVEAINAKHKLVIHAPRYVINLIILESYYNHTNTYFFYFEGCF